MLNVSSRDAILYKTELAQHETPRDMLELLHRLFDRETFSLIPAINFNIPLVKIDSLIQANPQLAFELLQTTYETRQRVISSPVNANSSARNFIERFTPSRNDAATTTVETYNVPDTNNFPPRYNILHPLVKEAILNTIREITVRYGVHQSFGGVGIILAQDSYMLLKEPLKSLDDWTIREFVKDTGTQIPDANLNNLRDRIEARAKFFRNNKSALESFINWRNVKVKEFYNEIVKTITDIRRDARLYLAADTILDQPEVKRFCFPSLPSSGTAMLSQRMLGYDPALICDIPSVTFLRPSRRSPDMQSELAAVYSAFDSVGVGSQFMRDGISFGTLFFNDPEQSPTVPASMHNRGRFVKQLAQSDVAMFFDGGNSLLNGESESLRDLFAVFRQLPPLQFKTFSYSANQSVEISTSAVISPATSVVSSMTNSNGSASGGGTNGAIGTNGNGVSSGGVGIGGVNGGGINGGGVNVGERSLQPITVRYANSGSGLFVYIVNDAPFETRADIEFKVSEGVEFYELSGRKKFEIGTWRDGRQRSSFRMESYSLVAVYVDDATTTIENVEVFRPDYICGTNGILHKWVEQLGQRIQISRSGVRWDKLINAGFDEIRERGERNFKKTELPKNILQNSAGHSDVSNYEYSEYRGWQALSTDGASASIDSTIKHDGNASLKLTSSGLEKNICVSSDPFELPATGRLFVSFFVGIKKDAVQSGGAVTGLTSPSLASSRAVDGLGTPMLFHVSVVEVGGDDVENGGNNANVNANIGVVGGVSGVVGSRGNGNDKLNRTFNVESLLRPELRGVKLSGDFQWYKVVVPFDRLPIDKDEEKNVVLRFSLSGESTIWVDDITLYQVAFTPEETNELFRLMSAADVRRLKYRVSDLMMLFDSYWVQFLLRNTPSKVNSAAANQVVSAGNLLNNNSPNPKIASTQPSTPTTPASNQSEKSPSIMKRIKSWIKWK
jgi:hypothetical protein